MDENTNIYGDDIRLTEINANTIYTTVIQQLESGAGEPLYPGDERRIFGEALVAVLVAVYNTMNDVGRQTMLRYARGEVLDALGERMGVTRLEGTAATTVIRFSVTAPVNKNIIIPKWTKVTADGSLYFATDNSVTLQAGSYNVDVPATAVANGAKFNGFAAGTITTLVDLVPYISNVVNIVETAGGDDGEPYTVDGDNHLRERIRIAPGKRSTAGAELDYIYFALTADARIADVKAISENDEIKGETDVYNNVAFIGGSRLQPQTLTVYAADGETPAIAGSDYTAEYSDDLLKITLAGDLAGSEKIKYKISRTLEGVVKIVPLLKGGKIPDEKILEKVVETCSAADVRPLTDKVIAAAPAVTEYDIDITYYTTPETEAEVIANVENSDGAIARYIEWQDTALGRDINPDQLRRLILAPDWAENLTGAIRVEVNAPQYTEIGDTEVAKFSGNLTVKHKAASGVI